jgi:hypothetical membrane protein
MLLSNKTRAGALMVIGTAWLLMAILVAEALYPGYTVTKMISDLGVGPTATVFNTAIFGFGLLAVASAWLLAKEGGDFWFVTLLTLSGLGAAGVGIFPETMPVPHAVCAGVAFLCGGLCALLSFRILSGPWVWFSGVLGGITLLAALLSATKVYLGLSAGGMERMIAYPLLIWAIGTGAYLMAPE